MANPGMQQMDQQVQGQMDANLQVLFHALSSSAIVPVQQLIGANPQLLKSKGWNGQTPLHRACLTGDRDMVRYLLEAGADPNEVNNFNETSVHYASKRGVPALVHLMVKYGGKLDVKDKIGRTPLHNAAQIGSVFMMKYFEEKGFNFKDVDNNFQSPLQMACGFGHLEAFKFLMRKGRSDPTHQDKDGNTALHICAKEGYAHGSWLLVNYIGLSSLHVQNKEGYTPCDIARQFESSKKEGHRELLGMVEELGNLPTNSEVKGPWMNWYLQLLGPALIYFLGLIPALFIVPNHQGIVLFAAIAFIIRHSKNTSHRLKHVSRWANPWYIGMFSAGIFHTMLVYYGHVTLYLQDHQGMYLFSIVACIFLLYQYWKLLILDPGVYANSLMNDKTKQPMMLADLCEAGTTLDHYCVECEMVRSKDTKHCKLCDKCFYRMDHHCLFLLKCVAYNNHSRFVWFLIQVGIVMFVFVFEAMYYISVVYPTMTNMERIKTMFWTDCWVLSMVILNILSVAWIVYLTRFQLILVSKAQTSYFQQSITTLTPIEQLMNVLNFLQGKTAFAVDYKFEAADMYPKQGAGDLYPRQPGYSAQQMGHGHSHQDSIKDV